MPLRSQRRSPDGEHESSAEEDDPTPIEQALMQECSASPNARLVQICYVDHSGRQYVSPHIHLQCLFTDNSRTPWINVAGSNAAALHQAARNMTPRVRLHRHEPGEAAAPNGGGASERVVKALPRLHLTEASAAHLRCSGADSCPCCLEGFAAKEAVIVWPCAGLHVGHAACIDRWLALASTCPTCRFALPRNPSPTELSKLMLPATRELERIQAAADDGMPLICQPVDEEPETPMPAAAAAADASPKRRAAAPAAPAAPAATSVAEEGSEGVWQSERVSEAAAATRPRPRPPLAARRFVRSPMEALARCLFVSGNASGQVAGRARRSAAGMA